jgi:Kef-type K+ transport system membrane component KefB
MSITAFPVLARMLQQFQIAQTQLGTLVLAMAAINDVTAWCLLALVLASLNRSPSVAFVTIGGGVLYTIGMVTFGRRGLRLFGRMASLNAESAKNLIIPVLLVVLICSWLTSAIGIYETFGAFVVGVILPRGRLADELQSRLQLVTTGLLLPIFFAYSGLSTQIALVNSPKLWIFCVTIIVIAIVGKGVATTLGSRLSGFPWRESAAIGALMNARGMIELIVLNIGLEAQVITPTLFTMLVLMALITTVMASPLYQWLHSRRDDKGHAKSVLEEAVRTTPYSASD